MNYDRVSGNFEIRYYDKRVPEEDVPVNVPVEKQTAYEKLDSFFERIFDENSLNVAKGIGRGVIAASMIYPFNSYVGIEYLENLHNIAVNIKEKFDENLKILREEHEDLVPKFTNEQNIELICGDFLTYDWKEASFIFANSTCFSPDLMLSLSKKAEELPIGAVFVTFTKRLPCLSDNWEINSGFRRLMSWGIATVYVHRKIN